MSCSKLQMIKSCEESRVFCNIQCVHLLHVKLCCTSQLVSTCTLCLNVRTIGTFYYFFFLICWMSIRTNIGVPKYKCVYKWRVIGSLATKSRQRDRVYKNGKEAHLALFSCTETHLGEQLKPATVGSYTGCHARCQPCMGWHLALPALPPEPQPSENL